MTKEIFRIAEDEGRWHVQGILPEDDRSAARLLNIIYDCTRRKVGEDTHLNVIVVTPEQLLEIPSTLG